MNIILHKDGAYNVYSTVSDSPLWSSALSLDQLKYVYKEEYGLAGLRELEPRLERAIKNGTSSLMGEESLEEFISSNRAGEDEATLNYNDFIEKYMTFNIL